MRKPAWSSRTAKLRGWLGEEVTNEPSGLVRRPAMDEFLVENDAPEDFLVVHAVDGHHYHFRVTRYENGKVLSSVAIIQNDVADHSENSFEGVANALRFERL
jgi:hypothetical protein